MNDIAAASLWWAAALIAVLATTFFCATRAFVLPRWRNRQLRRELGADSFDEDTIERAMQNYVEPDCSQLDPAGAEDPGGVVPFTKPLMPRMDELLRSDGTRRHYLLLADSGMGKTAFLLNYYERNRRRRQSKRLRLFLVSLGQPDALKKLEAVDRKSETIALLDAFDEDTAAIEDHRARLSEIMSACAQFKRVVISCRTRFFPNDGEIPRQTGVATAGSHQADQPHRDTFENLYLAPLSDRQIRKYIQRSVPWHKLRHRHRARSLVASMPDLMTRPTLLALVPELAIAGRQVSGLFELYEFMVERWLVQESDWIEPDLLRAVAKRLALTLYLRASDGSADRARPDELASIANLQRNDVDRWGLTTRSLLNRDAVGNFKFAHRAILEYLFLRTYIDDGESACLTPRWSAGVRQLFLSWATVAEARSGADFLRLVLSQDYSATGLFPLWAPQPPTGRLSKNQILNTAPPSRPSTGHRSSTWAIRRLCVTEHPSEDAVYLCDRGSDTVFYLAPDWRRVSTGEVDADTARLFVFTRSEVDRQTANFNERFRDKRRNWRLPTLEEFDLIYLWNLHTKALPGDLYVWTDDQSEDGSRLVVRMCESEQDDEPKVKVIGMRNVIGADDVSATYLVSSATLLGNKNQRGHYDPSFRALVVRVSHGAAESFARELRSSN